MPIRPTTSNDLLTGAASLAPLAARHAEDADLSRTLPDPVVEGVRTAGFARHFVPREHGGAAGTCGQLLRAVATVAEGCTSAAWYASVIAGAARMGAFLPARGQRELWAGGPDTVVVGALMPRGSATEVTGGWVLTGEWDFTSGVGFSDWALACALVPTDDAERPPESWFLALPRSDYRVRDSWHPVGMRATASNTLVADGVFVPRHRGFPREAMLTGRPQGSTARCHTAPLRLLSGVLFGAPALGAARNALRVWAGEVTASPRPGGPSAETRVAAARAAIAVDSAGLLMERAARVADAPEATPGEAARNPADCALAVEQLVDTVERLYRTVGSTGQLATHPLQRAWRDLHSLASHVALRFDTAGGTYGAHLLDPDR